MYACILIFFVTNMVEGQLISTGAFEVSLNGMYSLTCLLHIIVIYTCSRTKYVSTLLFTDMPIWSKLESGRLPNPNELHQIIENQLKFSPGH